MARLLNPSAFGDIDFGFRVYANQRFDLYRVYHSAYDFVEVTAPTAMAALAASGVKNPLRIVHQMPPLSARAVGQAEIVSINEGDEFQYTSPPELLSYADGGDEEIDYEFQPLTYGEYGTIQQKSRILSHFESMESNELSQASPAAQAGLTPEEVNELLDPAPAMPARPTERPNESEETK